VKKWLAYLMVHRSAHGKQDFAAFEARQAPDGSPHYNDSFYFCGRDHDGTSLVFRMGFRPGRETELWCDLVLPGRGRFRAPSSTGRDGGGLACCGLSFACREPGRAWSVTYAGPMHSEGRTVDVALDLSFQADAPIVDFGAHGDSWSLAGHLASQKWTRAWLSKLRDLRQVHYEQGGRLGGRIAVDGKQITVSLPAVRDHSFGARDWAAMRRHAWLMALLEDGRHVNLSLVGYDFLPYMHSGYRVAGGAIEAVTAAPRFDDLPAGNPAGRSFDCAFRVGARESLTLKCTVGDVLEYTMGGGYHFFEGCASFRLGETKGVGICEIGTAIDGQPRPAL
jgi:hypothetical protein